MKPIGTLMGPSDGPPGHGSEHDIDVAEDERLMVHLTCRCGRWRAELPTGSDVYRAAERHWASPSGLWIP